MPHPAAAATAAVKVVGFKLAHSNTPRERGRTKSITIRIYTRSDYRDPVQTKINQDYFVFQLGGI